MKAAAFIVVALGLMLAAIAAFLPATLVDRRLDAATQGKVRLADAAGTVWNGRGLVTDSGGTWRVPVGWSISRMDVLRGIHVVSLRPGDGASTPQGSVEVVDNGVRVRGLAAEIPAQALVSLAQLRALPLLGGTVAVSSQQFSWSPTEANGALAAKWTGARVVAGDAVADLGTVDLALAPQGNRLAGRVAGSGGDVRIDGTASLSTADVSVEGMAAPAPGAPPHIARALAALGTPDASGAVRIAWRGALK